MRHDARSAVSDSTQTPSTAVPLPQRIVVAAGLVWLSTRTLLVGRRPPDAEFGAGELELPGGKLEPGEGPRAALRRELEEEWGPGARMLRVGRIAEVLQHVVATEPGRADLDVILLVYHVRVDPGAPAITAATMTPAPGAEVLAFDREALPVEQFLEADRPFVRAVAAGLVTAPD